MVQTKWTILMVVTLCVVPLTIANETSTISETVDDVTESTTAAHARFSSSTIQPTSTTTSPLTSRTTNPPTSTTATQLTSSTTNQLISSTSSPPSFSTPAADLEGIETIDSGLVTETEIATGYFGNNSTNKPRKNDTILEVGSSPVYKCRVSVLGVEAVATSDLAPPKIRTAAKQFLAARLEAIKVRTEDDPQAYTEQALRLAKALMQITSSCTDSSNTVLDQAQTEIGSSIELRTWLRSRTNSQSYDRIPRYHPWLGQRARFESLLDVLDLECHTELYVLKDMAATLFKYKEFAPTAQRFIWAFGELSLMSSAHVTAYGMGAQQLSHDRLTLSASEFVAALIIGGQKLLARGAADYARMSRTPAIDVLAQFVSNTFWHEIPKERFNRTENRGFDSPSETFTTQTGPQKPTANTKKPSTISKPEVKPTSAGPFKVNTPPLLLFKESIPVTTGLSSFADFEPAKPHPSQFSTKFYGTSKAHYGPHVPFQAEFQTVHYTHPEYQPSLAQGHHMPRQGYQPQPEHYNPHIQFPNGYNQDALHHGYNW